MNLLAWNKLVIVLACVGVISGCDKSNDPADDNGDDNGETLECSPDWLKPCEVEACEACAAMGGEQFDIAESYPPQYGCADGQGRIEAFDGRDYCELPYCEDTVTVLDSRETETPAGVTAGDVLAVAEGEHTRALTWLPQETPGDIVLEPSGSTSLDLTVTHGAGEMRYVEREEVVPETDGVPDVGPGVVDCHATVEVDVTLQLVTADGGLDEALETSLVQVVDGEEAAAPAIANTLLWTEFAGSLSVGSIASGYTVDDDVALRIAFDADGPEGELESGVEHRGTDSVSYTELAIATW